MDSVTMAISTPLKDQKDEVREIVIEKIYVVTKSRHQFDGTS